MQKVIILSGGSRGLGQALAQHLLAQGHVVATLSRSATAFVHQAQQEYPQQFFYQALDMSDHAAIPQFVAAVSARYQRIDALINNAGIADDAVLPLQTDAAITRMIDLNLTATIHLTRACVRTLLTQHQPARIINIASVVGLRGFTGLSVYSATKAALLGFTQSLARELGRRAITVNCVAPGYIETEMSGGLNEQQRQQIIRRTPLNRLGTVDDIIPLIDFLLSEGARFITGQTLVVDGGLTC